MKNDKTLKQLLRENEELRIHLQEAEETLQAIREGAVDALVVSGPRGEQVFTLTSEEQVYRRLVETMSEAGLTTTLDGRILFCNERFREMLRRPMEEIIGRPIEEFVRKSDQKDMAELLASAPVKLSRKRIVFLAGDETEIPVRVSGNMLRQADSVSICMVAMDLTELETSEEITRQLQEQKAAIEESAARFRESRRAALNIAEDELAARQQAEKLNIELQQEVQDRKRAEEQIRRAAIRFEILSETASKLLESTRPQQIVNTLCRRVMELLDCHIFVNYLVDEQSHRLHLNASGGLPGKMARDIEWLDFGQAICGRVAQQGQRIVAEDIQESCDPRADLVRSVGIMAYACHPIMVQGKVIGTLSFGTRSRTSFNAADLATMKTVTDQVAAAMERMRTEEILRQNQEDLNRAQEVGIIGSWRLNVQKNVLAWSDENHRIFGVPKGTPMTYEGFLAIVHPDDRQYVDTKWKASLDGDNYDIEHRLLVDGQVKWVREKAYLEFDEKHELIGGFGITQDITRQKQMEEELRQSRDQLEIRVRERTSQLLQTVEALEDEVRHRIAAEKTVKAERKRFEDVLEMMPAYAILLKPDYHVAYANRTFRDWFGDDNGKKCYEFLFNRSNPCEDCQTYAVLKTGKSHFWEWTGPNGRNYDIYDYPFTDSDGSPLIMEIGVDVTAHKQAQEAVRAASLYTRSLIEASLDPLVTISADGKITDVNEATIRVTGLARHGLIGTDFADYFTEPGKARLGYREVFDKGFVTDYPLTIRHADGHLTDVLYNASLYKNTQGKVLGIFAAARDVTAYNQVQEALHKSEERYRSLTVATTQIVWTTDAQGQVVGDMPSWREFTGQTLEEMQGWGWINSLHPDDRQRTAEIWTQSVQNKTLYQTEYRIRRYDGQYRYMSVCGVPVLEPDGSIREWVGTCTDITERKQAQERIHFTNVLLEQFTKKTLRKKYLDSVVEYIQAWSGCQCVGIRLADGDGLIPYESCVGFSDEFLATENRLSLKNDNCLCIRAIMQTSELTDTPLMTQRGSFCSDNSFAFLESLSAGEKSRYRETCMRHGFASLAVLPIRYRDQIVGAIHLADERPGRAPAEMIEFLEHTAMLIGEAVHRFDVEQKLREREEQYRLLVELSPDGIGVEKDGKIVFINTMGATLLGCRSPEDLIGRDILDFVHPDYKEQVVKQLNYLRKKRKPLVLREGKFLRADGTTIEVEVAASPLDYQHTTSAQIVFHDITSRKEAEASIRQHQQALRTMAAQLQLVEEQERRRIAQDIHDSIGQILAFSKMQINNVRKNLPEPHSQSLEKISNHLDTAIQQARTLSFDLSPSILYDLGFKVAVEDLVERFSEERNIPCHFEGCQMDLPMDDNVKILLYRSVRELLINAAKHAMADRIKVSLLRSDADVHIIVEDNGRGFDAAVLKDNTQRIGGFGLFSICERLNHIGGQLKIESAERKGTKAVLIAPLSLEENKES